MKSNEFIVEKWSQKYKSSINCSHPKGFSQRAHCAGKKKHNESVEMEMVCEDCGMCETHGNIMEIKKGQKDSNGYTKCWPGKHAEGTKKSAVTGKQVRNCVPNESISEENKGLYYNVNKRKKAGTSRDADSPLAPTAQAWKDAAKTAKKQGVAEGLVGDVVVHNYTKMPIDLEPGQAQIAGWGPNDEPLYRVKGQDGKEVKTWSKRRMLTIAKEQGVAEGVSLKQKHEDKKRADQNQVRYGKMTQAEFDKKWTRTERPKPTNKEQGVAEGLTENVYSLEQAHAIFDDFEQAMADRGLTEDIFDFFTDEEIILETAAWRRSAGKSKKGGLNAKGVASYRRENPGSKLQMAVTTKPSKLKPGSKAAKRRKSFCARMGGVKGPMKKPNGKPTRKALALRKWNC